MFFERVLYFGWPNQPSSGTMGILHRDVFSFYVFQKGRAIVPDGLNIREETFNRFLLLYFVYLLFYFTICLSVIYTVNYFYVFPGISYIKKHVPMQHFHCT